jgi:hypothetical protein
MPTHSDEIQQQADLLLQQSITSFFIEAGYKLRINPFFYEKGLDFHIEIETRTEPSDTVSFFYIQNKGIQNGISLIKGGIHKGKISYQLKHYRYVSYYCKILNYPIFITICDLKTRSVYWEAIQLNSENYSFVAESIFSDVKKGNRKTNSFTIYVDPQNVIIENGKIVQSNFEKFYSDHEKSQIFITRRNYRKLRMNERVEHFKDIIVDRNQPILQQIYSYLTKRFKDINVLPLYFWGNDYPFRASNAAYFEYLDFTLYTNNSEVFELFKSISIDNFTDVRFNDKKYIVNVKDYISKAKTILSILSRNLVFKIGKAGTNEVTGILFFPSDSPSAVEEDYVQLRLDRTISILSHGENVADQVEELAYQHFEFGNYFTSARLYLRLLGNEKENFKGRKFIYAYNLGKLLPYLATPYSDEDVDDDVVSQVKKIKVAFALDDSVISGDEKLTSWIKEDQFITYYEKEVREAFNSIRDHYYRTLNGGRGRTSHIQDLHLEHAWLLHFLNANRIIYHEAPRIKDLFDLYSEGVILSLAIHESHYSRLEAVDDWTIKTLILFGKPDQLQKYVNRYWIKSIKYSHNSLLQDGFIDISKNFFRSSSAFSHRTNWNYTFTVTEKYRRILGNIIILGALLEQSERDVEEFAKELLLYLQTPIIINCPLEIRNIKLFIGVKGKFLSLEMLKSFYDLHFQIEHLQEDNFLVSIRQVLKERETGFEMNESDLLKVENYFFSKNSERPRSIDLALLVSHFLVAKNDSAKQYIKNIIINILDNSFHWKLYYLASIYEILGANDSYYQQFLNMFLPFEPEITMLSRYNRDEINRDSRVGALLNLCFKYGISLPNEVSKAIGDFDPYYHWLINMKDFDYRQFNPRWVSEYATDYYLKEMSKFPIISEKVNEYLRTNLDPVLSQTYLKLTGFQKYQ